MTQSSIKALVSAQGLKHKDLAERLDCSESELSQMINGHRVNQPLQERFASFFGRKRERVFDAKFYASVALRRSA
jgi:plasmid maintenance system antidote protein VapI